MSRDAFDYSVRVEARGVVGLSPEAIWPLLADTPRLNRAIGLPPMHYRATPAPAGGSRIVVDYRLGPIPYARWTEHPFEWEEPRRYSVQRDMHWGPIASVHGGAEITPLDATAGELRTEILVFANFAPRGPLGALLARYIAGPRLTKTVLDQCRQFERYLRGHARSPFPQLAKARNMRGDRLDALAATLRSQGHDPTLVDHLRDHLLAAADEEVVRMRAFELADRWGHDRRATLTLFLQATIAGLLVLTWDVLCPSCRVAKAEYRSLREVGAEGHCDACNLNFDARFAKLIEARFRVAPSVRGVDSCEYCTGGPRAVPHVITQARVAPSLAESAEVELRTGSYLVRSPQIKRLAPLDVTSPATVAEATPANSHPTLAIGLSDETIELDAATMRPGPTRIDFINHSRQPITAIFERGEWPDTAATAAYLGTLAEFRDLFSAEALAPGLEVAIENLAFLFSDLTGSTTLYEQLGQARAFRLVQEHFALLDRAIRAEGGAIVKTIGDAVMAVFPTGKDALAAGIAMQRAIGGLDTAGFADPRWLLRVGIHQGPCLAVTLNDRLDYFGTTINLASRIEHESRGGEIVIAEALLRAPGAAAVLAGAPFAAESFVVTLRGLREPIKLARLRPVGALTTLAG